MTKNEPDGQNEASGTTRKGVFAYKLCLGHQKEL